MTTSSSEWFWPINQWPEAIETLAREAKLLNARGSADLPKLRSDEMKLNTQNIELVANYLGIESEPMRITYDEVESVLKRGGPMLLTVTHLETDETSLILVLYAQGANLCLITSMLKREQVALSQIRQHLCAAVEHNYGKTFDAILDKAALPTQQRTRVRQNLLHEQFSSSEVSNGWQLRLLPSNSLWQQAREFDIPRLLFVLLISIVLSQIFIIGSWAMLGQSLLSNNQLDATSVSLRTATIGAWALMLISDLPIQLLSYITSGNIAALMGSAYRRTLLYGALKLHPNEIRHQGSGEFLSRAIDADAIQQGTMWGAFAVIWSSSQLISAFSILLANDHSLVSAGLLLGIFLLQLAVTYGYSRDYRLWQNSVRHITNRLVESMVGYRTRIAQQPPAEWHDEEDRDLADYYRVSEQQANFRTALNGMTHLWVVFGVAGLIWSFSQYTLSQTEIAIRLGAILLALQGLNGMEKQFLTLVRLNTSWQQVKPIFSASQRSSEKGMAALFAQRPGPQASSEASTDTPQTLMIAHNLSFRYSGRGRLALNNVNLQVDKGDHLLIEGPSGGGKSTLVSVLAGLNPPESGLLLLHGFDRASMGFSAWRKSVVMVPQFHENHVFVGTFSFNLLMGRRWPPTPEDEHAAYDICAELGLNDLIERMPSGIQQIVGESGWQLSHGERSRLFIARALLQEADVLILDESFGALDPESMALAMQCVLRRAPTMIVIAHP